MPTLLKALLILNFVVEALSGLCMTIMPEQTAAVLYPDLEANALALKFARTTGTAIVVLGLLSILVFLDRFRAALPLILVVLSVYHLLATAHNAYLLAAGGGSLPPTAVHAILLAGFVIYSAKEEGKRS